MKRINLSRSDGIHLTAFYMHVHDHICMGATYIHVVLQCQHSPFTDYFQAGCIRNVDQYQGM